MSTEIYSIKDSSIYLDREENRLQFDVETQFTAAYTGSHFYIGKLPGKTNRNIAKFSVFNGGSRREWDGYTLAFAHNIPTPLPIALVSRLHDPKDGLITELLEGPQLSEGHTDNDLFALGGVLHRLHQIAVPGYGLIDHSVPQFFSMDKYLSHWLEKTLPYIEKDSDLRTIFDELYSAASQRIDKQDPRFVHRDLKLENVLRDNNQVKLIDFEWWQGGDPMDDLAVTLYHFIRKDEDISAFNQLIDGYFPEQNGMSDLEVTSLNFYLFLAAIRVVSFCERVNPAKKVEAYQDLSKVVNYLDTEHLFKR